MDFLSDGKAEILLKKGSLLESCEYIWVQLFLHTSKCKIYKNCEIIVNGSNFFVCCIIQKEPTVTVDSIHSII